MEYGAGGGMEKGMVAGSERVPVGTCYCGTDVSGRARSTWHGPRTQSRARISQQAPLGRLLWSSDQARRS